METHYLVDFENVHDDGIKNIGQIDKDEYVYIFYTKNADRMSVDLAFPQNGNVRTYKVASGNQSADKHILSFLGFLMGKNAGKQCKYVIIGNDTGYDNIIKFWEAEGYKNISRLKEIPSKKSSANRKVATKTQSTEQKPSTQNAIISKSLDKVKSGDDRTELNEFVQHRLKEMGYGSKAFNRICSYVVQYSNSERQLSEIHNAIKVDFPDKASEVYEDVKKVLKEFSQYQKKNKKR